MAQVAIDPTPWFHPIKDTTEIYQQVFSHNTQNTFLTILNTNVIVFSEHSETYFSTLNFMNTKGTL